MRALSSLSKVAFRSHGGRMATEAHWNGRETWKGPGGFVGFCLKGLSFFEFQVLMWCAWNVYVKYQWVVVCTFKVNSEQNSRLAGLSGVQRDIYLQAESPRDVSCIQFIAFGESCNPLALDFWGPFKYQADVLSSVNQEFVKVHELSHRAERAFVIELY